MTTEQKIKEWKEQLWKIYGVPLYDENNKHFPKMGINPLAFELGFKSALSLIPKWRKVEEELPERSKHFKFESERVLTLAKMRGGIYIKENVYYFGLKKWDILSEYIIGWMPQSILIPNESELLNLIPK